MALSQGIPLLAISVCKSISGALPFNNYSWHKHTCHHLVRRGSIYNHALVKRALVGCDRSGCDDVEDVLESWQFPLHHQIVVKDLFGRVEQLARFPFIGRVNAGSVGIRI